jgi:ABC-type branched-subunit amino acid transport system substrate-binding protein
LVAPFEGRYRLIGYDVIYSARLAVREINAAGGIDGHRVALVALDDGGDPQLAYDAARTLSIDPNVVAVVGHWLPETTAAATPVYAEAGLPLVALHSAENGTVAVISAEFFNAYTAITPFGEEPGANAVLAYSAIITLFDQMAQTAREHGTINRQTLGATLGSLSDS